MPFEEFDDADNVEHHLEMAEELDAMERDVSSWEAEFLESILKQLREARPLTPKQEDKLEEMYRNYIELDLEMGKDD